MLWGRRVTGPAAWASSLTTLPPPSASEGFLEASVTAWEEVAGEHCLSQQVYL